MESASCLRETKKKNHQRDFYIGKFSSPHYRKKWNATSFDFRAGDIVKYAFERHNAYIREGRWKWRWKKRERGGSETNHKHTRNVKNDPTAGWLRVFASGLRSKLSTKAVMFIQVAVCSFSSPACVSLTLGYSEDSTSTRPAHSRSFVCEVPDNRLLRGRTVTSRLQNSTPFCPSPHPCSWLRSSERLPCAQKERSKSQQDGWRGKSPFWEGHPFSAYRLSRLRP